MVAGLWVGAALGAELGAASTYGHKDSYHGKPTANGERFDTYRTHDLTCAHRAPMPFGTRLRVTSLRTGKAIECRVNDRGPFIRGRIVDVSYAAAQMLGMGNSVAPVMVEVVP